jgi:autotransporter-associated beta strand protein
MSLDANWASGGHPANGENGPIVLVFPNTATSFSVIDDIDGLNVDQIQFTGAASNYVISGAAGSAPITLNLTGASATKPNIDDQVGGNTFSATNLTLALSTNNTTQVNVTTGSLTVASPITGQGGFLKVGDGTMILVGANTFSSPTVIDNGNLEVDGAAGAIRLAGLGAGILSGTGTVGTVISDRGTVSPGAVGSSPIGILRSQTVTWGAGTTFFVDLAHTSTGNPVPGIDNDLLAVNGNVTLNGIGLGSANLAGSVLPSVRVGDRFTIIQTTGGTIKGTFATGNTVVLGGFKFDIDISDPTRVVLQRVLADTTTTVTSSLNPGVFGQNVLYTATVTPEAGTGIIPTTDTVTFTFDGVTYPPVPLQNGQAVFDPQAATGGLLSVTTPSTLHTLHAAFSGDATLFNPSAADLTPAQTILPTEQTLSYHQGTFTAPVPTGDTVTLAGSMAFFYHRDLALALPAGGFFQNSAGMNERWLRGNANAFGNPWYFIKPSGQLFAWDGTPAARGSSLVGTLDPVYYVYPDLLYNPTQGMLDIVLQQRLGLTFTGNFSQNYGGQNEKWLQGIVNTYGNPWYFIDTTGRLYAWNGAPNQATGTLLAALDPLYWAQPQRLYNAQPNEVTAAIANNSLQVTTVKDWAGRVVVEISSTTPTVTHQTFTINFVSHPTSITVTPNGDQTTAPGQPVVLTVNANNADNDPMTLSGVAGHLGYVLEQSLGLRLQGSLSFNYGGQSEEWLQSTLGNWYFIKPNGQLFLWDGTPGQASGTLISTLDPIYYYHPDLLYNAPAGDLASALDQRLNLRGTTADFSQNYGGLSEKWVLGADGWYFITSDGKLWKWLNRLNQTTGTLAQPGGAVDPSTGTLVATLDPQYYTDIQRLLSDPNVTIAQTGNTLTVTPSTSYIGDIWVVAQASDGIQVASAPPVRLISRPDTITFWEMTGTLSPYTFAVNSPQMLTRLSDPLSATNADFVTPAHEFYDVFFSNSDGSFNPQGGFVTIECSFAYASPYGGGLNIAEIDLNHTDGTVDHASTVTSATYLGNNAIAGSAANAVDNNLQTWTTMGNTIGQSQRLRITVSFNLG